MNADLLSAALDAYRDEHSSRAFRANVVRRRVLAGVSRRRERRARLLRFALPTAATFVASAALAASEPGRSRVERVFERVEALLSGNTGGPRARPPREPDAENREGRGSVPAPVPRLTPAPELEAPVFSLEELPLATESKDTPSPGPSHAHAAPPAWPDLDLESYRRAHALHFHGTDANAALAAWNAYLAEFPGGTFVPEARLNRAVCLARLGKRRDAERSLDTIARHGEDAYARARAEALLDVLAPERMNDRDR